jgi:hypothetical protein
LSHPAADVLDRPLVHYIGNQPAKACDHFFGLREAKRDLTGIAILDRLDFPLQDSGPLEMRMWQRREIENYLTSREGLLDYAEAQATGIMAGPLFEVREKQRLRNTMSMAIAEIAEALAKLGKPDPFSGDIKASEEFLTPVLRLFFEKLGLPDLMQKSDFHTLVKFLPVSEIAEEVGQTLDTIASVARAAHPALEE